MAHCSLEITFRDGKLMAGYLQLDRRPNDRSVRTKELPYGVVADYAEDDRLIGLEFTAPSLITRETVRDLLRQLHLPDARAEELAPLVRIATTAA